MIVIMGATGCTGSALLQRLDTLGVPSRALSRDPDRLSAMLSTSARSSVEVRKADAADPASLRAAFTGARQLFLSMVNSPEQVELETRVIEIAAESGIEHIVKLSAPGADPNSPVAIARWHYTIEETLKASGLSHTLLRPYAFMQKLLLLAPTVSTQGVIAGAMQDAACNYIDCRDIADVAAEALTNPEIAGRTYTLTGEQTYSYPHIAEMLTTLLKKQIRYADLPPEVFRRSLIDQAHLPDWLAAHIVEIQQMAVRHREEPTNTAAQLLGREPRTLEAFLQENIRQFQ